MNVVWIVADTFRRDHLGAYGNNTIQTPSLDALATRSVRFDRHYFAAFPTMPARADFFTGRWTMSYMQWDPLPEGEMSLAQILSNKGIQSTAIVDTPFFSRNGMNYDKGFVTYFEIPGQTTGRGETIDVRGAWRTESDRFAPRTFTTAMHWLERHYKEDFFLYIDTWDPHEPFDAPDYYSELYWPGYDGEHIKPCYGYWRDYPDMTEERVKKSHATYCGEITMVDTWTGYFLRHLENMGLMENTAIIFTTDHGFYFGEHGGMFGKTVRATNPESSIFGHAAASAAWARSPFYEEVASCPLFIYVPEGSPGIYNGLTSAVDLAPTVLELMGQEIPSIMEGQSLMPQLKDPMTAGREFVISGSPFANKGDTVKVVDDQKRLMAEASETTVTTEDWSLLYSIQPGVSELYHLPSDPRQERNVIGTKPEVAKELHQLLVKFMYETKLPARLLEPRLELRL